VSARAEAFQVDRHERMRTIVEDNRRLVARMLRKGGVPRNELDDEIQRTFIVAARRLQDVTPGAERSFLFQVARNRASHARRSMARCRECPTDELPERSESRGTPEDLTGRKQMRVLLDAALASLDESLRSVFVLFEIEGLDMHEIAVTLGLPRGTVASRLRRGRAQIRRSLPVLELAWSLGLDDAEQLEGPALMRSERGSRLERALLRTGTATPVSSSLRERTLASCRVLVRR
jgi:RNA polymerase sigma-70 factor (ECF subfamily)